LPAVSSADKAKKYVWPFGRLKAVERVAILIENGDPVKLYMPDPVPI